MLIKLCTSQGKRNKKIFIKKNTLHYGYQVTNAEWLIIHLTRKLILLDRKNLSLHIFTYIILLMNEVYNLI